MKPVANQERCPGVCIILALLLLLPCLGCRPDRRQAPVAGHGVLDLSGWDMDKGGPVALDGEWEFYPDRLLRPEDFHGATPVTPEDYLRLPGDWNGETVSGRALPGQGQATLRLRILPGPGRGELCLRLFDVKSAYVLWRNGKPLAESGTLGSSGAAEIPCLSVRLPAFPDDGQAIELVLQISNHHYWGGGVLSSIRLGPAATLRFEQAREWALAGFFAGSLLVMGLYHLVLFLFRKNAPPPFFFGCYCLLWLGNFSCSESSVWIVRFLFPQASTIVLDRLALGCFFLSIPVGYRFFHALYPREFPRLLLHLTQVLGVGFTLLALAGPFLVLTTVLPAYYLISSLLIFYCLFMLHRARQRGREGAGFILAGFCFLGVTGLNDMLFDIGFIDSTSLISVGMFVFIFFQSLALARRFSRAFTAVEHLSDELESKNLALETEMAERTRLASEIVTVTEEERRRLSHDLHDGLCQQLSGARLRCSALSRRVMSEQSMAEDVSALSDLLEDSVGQAYDLSRGLWPVEHDPENAGPSLEELARRVSEATGIAIEFSQVLACLPCRNAHVVQLYRIAQEAVANAVKHGKPSRIAISLGCDASRTLTLTVRDDGLGRQAASPSRSGKGGLGLRIMNHRARMIGAALSITDAAEGGTVVVCRLACAEQVPPARITA
jgi:signal transduction histidine kinase